MSEAIPMLGEHQAGAESTNTTSPAGYVPEAEEKKAISLAYRLYEKGKAGRKKKDEHWADDYNMFRGKQWKEQRPSYRHSEVINMIFQTIQSQVPIVTDARPRFEFLPQDPSDFEFAHILNEVADSDWQRLNWTYKLAEIVYDSHIYGTGIPSMEWDPKARMGVGDIRMRGEDVFYCFPDPDARDVNEECGFFVHAEPVTLGKLKQEYPDKAKWLHSDLKDPAQAGKHEPDEMTRYRSPLDQRTTMEGTSPYDVKHGDKVLKITAWLKSDEFVEEKKTDIGEDGLPKDTYIQKLKYPNGRKICVAAGVLLADDANPYEDGQFPYARLVNYIDPRAFWGISEIEQLRSPQKIFNKLVSFALDVLTLMGNPIWIVDSSSGVDTDNLFNRPGLVVEKEAGSEVRREQGVALQPYVLDIIDRLRTWFDGISGANEVTRGVRPDGITAASAISSLQEAAQTRLRLKSRNLDACLQQLGQLWLSRRLQFSTAPEIVRITNNPNAQKYFKISVQTTQTPDGEEKKMARVIPYLQDPQTGQFAEGTPKDYLLSKSFDVKVNTGSTLPFMKDRKQQLAFQLYDRQAIDQEELLKAVEYPNHEAVMMRMQEKAQLMQMQQAAAQAQASNASMGAGGGAPQPPAPPAA